MYRRTYSRWYCRQCAHITEWKIMTSYTESNSKMVMLESLELLSGKNDIQFLLHQLFILKALLGLKNYTI